MIRFEYKIILFFNITLYTLILLPFLFTFISVIKYYIL